MRMIATLAATTVMTAALLATVGVCAASAATPSVATAVSATAVEGDVSAAQGAYHRTFAVTNDSRYTLTLMDYDGANRDDELTGRGAVVGPGQQIFFNVAYMFMARHSVLAQFMVTDPQGNQLTEYCPRFIVDEIGRTDLEVQDIPHVIGWTRPSYGPGELQNTVLFDRVSAPPTVGGQQATP